MPLKTVFQAEIQFLQILDENGNFDAELAKDTLSTEDVKFLYEQMVINRAFDEAAFMLQRSGRMGTFPQGKGQEAAALGAARAMKKGVDYLVPYYRENPASFLLGLPMHQILLHWMGDERGNKIDRKLNISPLCVAIGTQTLHAAGIAWAFKLRKEKRAVICFFGEGGTSTGDFHEAMNFASVFKLPVVFSCMNNNWAISVPISRQTAAQTFAQKAIAYGMPGVRIDGNDIFAAYKAHKEALDRARDGGGPTFIENVTYRLGDHTTADDARRYRDAAELTAAQARDPIPRTRKFLESRKLWDDAQQAKLEQRTKVIISEVIQAATTIENPSFEDIFDYTYEKLPAELLRQCETRRTD
ncbi:MAG: pyruvate dehydrogenase (acetyl-transferring) E1 component subunit alpha, partial [Tepidisphaeraceae bacterium]